MAGMLVVSYPKTQMALNDLFRNECLLPSRHLPSSPEISNTITCLTALASIFLINENLYAYRFQMILKTHYLNNVQKVKKTFTAILNVYLLNSLQ